MQLTVRLLGTEVLHLEIGRGASASPEHPQIEASGGGQFELGFQAPAPWQHVERDAEGP